LKQIPKQAFVKDDFETDTEVVPWLLTTQLAWFTVKMMYLVPEGQLPAPQPAGQLYNPLTTSERLADEAPEGPGGP